MQINSAKLRGWFHILRIITKAMSLKRKKEGTLWNPLLFTFHILLTDAAIRGNMIVCETRIYSESMFNVTNKITSFTYVCFIGWEEDHRNRHVAHQKNKQTSPRQLLSAFKKKHIVNQKLQSDIFRKRKCKRFYRIDF